MDLNFRQQFSEKWVRYFKDSDLPMAFFYTNQPDVAPPPEEELHCIIEQLSRTRLGGSLVLSGDMKFCSNQHPFTASAKYLVFKRFDQLTLADEPIAVIFFAAPDDLSGLFTLANFDESDPNSVIAPMGSGCASIIQYPYFEYQSAKPRVVLGMFDVSARPHVPAGELTFTIPWLKFVRMVENMDESFLITGSWERLVNGRGLSVRL